MGKFERMLEGMRAKWRTRWNIEAMGPEGAADIGLSPADLREIATQPGDVPERMRRMAVVFSAEALMDRLDRFQVLDMARACAACAERRACNRALHGRTAPKQEDCGFCPNAEAYRALGRAAA